ncbi:MAG: hypothetical protein P8179_18255 [Candidatus Thiodiazotropha sp.]
MSFRREDFFGLDFSWFCYDNLGMIGEFITGYGFIPNHIFNDETSYNHMLEYFYRLPCTSNSELSSAIKKRAKRSHGDFTIFLKKSRTGLFVYDYKGHYGPYERISIPSKPLLIEQVPDNIKKTLVKAPATFSGDETIVF